MITGELRSKVDRIWDTMWSGGISDPLSVIEQLTYLLFIKRLDEPSSRLEETWSNPPEPDVPGRGELVTRMDRIDSELNDLQSIMSRINRRLERPLA